jgi:AcrR family transcriptional regulator
MPVAHDKVRKGSVKLNVRPLPVGGVKIREAFKALLEEKEFNAITTAQISRKSGVNEALIYKYFGDKRGLLHQVLRDYLDEYLGQMESELKGIKGTFNKLKKIVWSQMNLYESKRVLAKILLLEVRNYPAYFESESYGQVQRFSRIITEILKEGIKDGEIRNDIAVTSMRQVILGGIEHLCLPKIIYGKPYSAKELTRELCMAVFAGIAKRPS